MSTQNYFARDYVQARRGFIERARRRHAVLRQRTIAALGPNGETLAIDCAYLGPSTPHRLLVACSGTHGAEGFAGSAIQQGWLDANESLPSGTGCLLVHALNPYGFAWLRRTNEHNVDLNRNALERFPGPANPAYAQLDAWLNTPSPPSAWDFFWLKAVWYYWRLGLPTLKQAIAGGQYAFPKGLFYGGEQQEASIAYLREMICGQEYLGVERAVVLDIHTGLGDYGAYQLLVDAPEDSDRYQDLQRWYGNEHLSGNRPEDSIAYRSSGEITDMIGRCLPSSQVYGGVLEFGTVSLPRIIAALRRENRAYFYAGIDSTPYHRAQAALRKACCPDDARWRARVVEQGVQVLNQSIRALQT